MAEHAPDIYDIEFRDIYEIEFGDFEETAEAAERPALELVPMPESSIGERIDLEEVAPVSINECALTRPITLPTETMQTEEVGEQASREDIPPHILEVAEKAITSLLEVSSKRVIPVAQISDLAFDGQRVPKEEFGNFLDTLNQDDRLEYDGEGNYIVKIGEMATKPYWPGEDPEVDPDKRTLLVDAAVLKLAEVSAWGLKSGQILGIIKSFGEYLSQNEVNEFFAILATHPNVSSLESGNFAFKQDTEFKPQSPNFDESKFTKEAEDPDRPMTPKQVSKALKNMKHSPEFRKAKDDMKRLANPRRRGRKKNSGLGPIGGLSAKKGYQGKAHGKKVTLDSLLSQSG